MKTKNLLVKLSKKFPKRIAKQYHDHVGLMTGKMPQEVHKIVLCLDMDYSIFPQIKDIHPDMIITHHPLVFGTKSRVFKFDPLKKALCDDLDALNIPVYSFHTNFDTGEDGMNDALSRALELQDIYAPVKEPMMRIGYLKEPLNIYDFAKYAKEKLGVSYGLLIHEGGDTIKKVGIIGGGGSRDYPVAKEEGCDIYISGDVSHHVRRGMVIDKFNYLDLPHEIERIFMKAMKDVLIKIDDSLEIIIIDHEELPEVV